MYKICWRERSGGIHGKAQINKCSAAIPLSELEKDIARLNKKWPHILHWAGLSSEERN